MTASEYEDLNANAAQAITLIEGTTEQALLRGIVAAAESFDFMKPLPDLHIRQQRSWEPAARHYRDLTETEKAEQA